MNFCCLNGSRRSSIKLSINIFRIFRLQQPIFLSKIEDFFGGIIKKSFQLSSRLGFHACRKGKRKGGDGGEDADTVVKRFKRQRMGGGKHGGGRKRR